MYSDIILTIALVGLVLLVNYKLNLLAEKLKKTFDENNEDARRIKIRQAFARNRERKIIEASK